MAKRPRRILLKLSGEALGLPGGSGYDAGALRGIAREIAALPAAGVSCAVVVGGGNLVRGRDLPPDAVDRTVADAAGMLATLANAVVLAEAVRRAGTPARALSAVPVPDVAPSFRAGEARALLDGGTIVVVGGGTGRPLFTTDTAAALRAVEVGADLLLKATQVDGVYDRDPRRDPAAKRFRTLSFAEALERRLEVMDRTAFTLCEENALPVVVFALRPEGNLLRAARGESVGTLVGPRPAGAQPSRPRLRGK